MNHSEKTNQTVDKICKCCGSTFQVKRKLRNVPRSYCSRSCATSARNSNSKTLPLEFYLGKLPNYIKINNKEDYKNTRSKIDFLDTEFNEIFRSNIWNVLTGVSCKSRQVSELREKTILNIKERIPDGIEFIPESYVSSKKKAKFYDIKNNEYFWAIPLNVIRGKTNSVSTKKEKRMIFRKNLWEKSLEEYRKTVPSFLKLHEETFKGVAKKAKFTDLEYNITYWARCKLDDTKYGVGICKERYLKEFRERSCLSEEEIKSRLFKVYGDEIQIDFSSYKSYHEIAIFKSKSGDIMRYTVNDALAGHLKGARGKIIAWTQGVKERDKKCLITGETEKLHAHHIYSKKSFPKYQFEVHNGITLCEKIHKEFHSKYGIKNNTKAQLLEFAMSKGIDLSEKLKNCPNTP